MEIVCDRGVRLLVCLRVCVWLCLLCCEDEDGNLGEGAEMVFGWCVSGGFGRTKKEVRRSTICCRAGGSSGEGGGGERKGNRVTDKLHAVAALKDEETGAMVYLVGEGKGRESLGGEGGGFSLGVRCTDFWLEGMKVVCMGLGARRRT